MFEKKTRYNYTMNSFKGYTMNSFIWFVQSNSVQRYTLFIYYRNGLHDRVESPETEILSKEITELHAKEEFKLDGCSEKFPSNSIGIHFSKEGINFLQAVIGDLYWSQCKPM